ncbi:hypothetical protein [Acetivibrio straminisolvens]|uniref:Uncharacterized protein n=1 Tax=Acetivibrio straminisolvens JCM 21531 TaxID=1294263 RepID=W4V759_9FIRM|nr:hypothetical protein [Acetivibrio straminisolvens]GAE88574.1 hypothetical protein JCM21531_2026 [Acetivibrio straminisolvens JCM 21531]
MVECICSGCRNLKRLIDDDGKETYECSFGFPSDKCEDCQEEECDIVCNNYEEDSVEADYILVSCKNCGKELKKMYNDSDDPEGEIFCVECYLKRQL